MAPRRVKVPLAILSALACACAALSLAGCGETAGQRESGKAGPAAERQEARSREFLAGREAPVYGYEVIETHDHDPGDFTQGLALDGGILYEGTGLRGRSRLIKSELEGGEILDVHQLAPEYFGEGVTVMGDEVFQLTYASHQGFVYGKEDLEQLRTFAYATEGWGLTHDGESLIMSDGTAVLRFLDPADGEERGRVHVSDNLGSVPMLNELEYIEGEVYANVWLTDLIAIISPRTGEVTGWIDLAGLNPDPGNLVDPYVLNGIAYDPETGHLLVTGKCWPHIYEIALVPGSL